MSCVSKGRDTTSERASRSIWGPPIPDGPGLIATRLSANSLKTSVQDFSSPLQASSMTSALSRSGYCLSLQARGVLLAHLSAKDD